MILISGRELVYKTLNFQCPERVPRQLWVLPWAVNNHSEELKKIQKVFPDDIVGSPGFNKVIPKTDGDPYEVGTYIDHWGCKFTNYQKGIIGEIKEPLIKEEDWEDRDNLRIPEENLTIDIEKVNEFCRKTDKFVIPSVFPRPFERLQFIRGTEQLYVDLMLEPEGLFEVIDKVHDYYCKLLETWAKTDVDGLMWMDDWGSQLSLLINPKIWIKIFKPIYKDFIDIAHRNNKKIFMHSDGYILEIIPHLIELGLDALNSQVFCMGLENLQTFKGKITFWGEIDRQHLLPNGTQEEIENAVKHVNEKLWSNGGCIAQCEFGLGAKPENVYKVFETWNRVL
ncbi:uroporphyrinogen decarboxylase family protein [Clostridium sediminicola]|uniref:uroporphyrinogen decarboxylase family protein n=1 Tax=Clostridium sediminicola TaxID=3114879 RepID=UPI003D17556B